MANKVNLNLNAFNFGAENKKSIFFVFCVFQVFGGQNSVWWPLCAVCKSALTVSEPYIINYRINTRRQTLTDNTLLISGPERPEVGKRLCVPFAPASRAALLNSSRKPLACKTYTVCAKLKHTHTTYLNSLNVGALELVG